MFFVIGTKPMLSYLATHYISSLYLPSEQSCLMDDLVKAFPAVAVLDMDALMG